MNPARTVVTALARRIRGGTVVVSEDGDVETFGSDPSREVAVDVVDPRAWRATLRDGSTGLGDGYEAGWWTTDDLVGLLRVLVASTAPLDDLRNRIHSMSGPVGDAIRRVRRTDPRRDRQNIAAHYDLSNDFFSLFLDETMTYSAGVFASPEVSLRAAQEHKIDRLLAKLDVGADDHLLEIGTGWGGLSIRAVETTDARVTTTTISREQADLARKRIAARGLTERIDLIEVDWRNLTGIHDKLVSVEMIEAVDWRDHDAFFTTCARLVKPEGLVGIQAIVIADDRFERAKVTHDFIKRRIFPGGCLASVSSMTVSAASAGLRLVDLEDLGGHYAETLARWRDRLLARADEVADLGLPSGLLRRFEFYLAYCEAAFAERHVSVVQAVFARDGWRPGTVGTRPV
ncbi:MAG: cyclopropane-fatty-acyl-phospholipid synthase family protein [Acidimicrobiales bacterium]